MQLYTAPEHHIELWHVDNWNKGQTVWHMRFLLPDSYEERKRGWVVNVTSKNGVSTRQRFCYNKEEALAFMEINYGVQR